MPQTGTIQNQKHYQLSRITSLTCTDMMTWIRLGETMIKYNIIGYNTVSGVSYASVYKQTHSRECCNLFISCLWTEPVIVLPGVYATVHLNWHLEGYQFCACTQCLRD